MTKEKASLSFKTVPAQPIYGSMAQIIRDDIGGSLLIIQQSEKQVQIKISDLWAYLGTQDDTLLAKSLGGMILGNAALTPDNKLDDTAAA